MSGSQLIEESGRGKLVTKNKKKERGKEMLVTKYQKRIRERKAGYKQSNKFRERKAGHILSPKFYPVLFIHPWIWMHGLVICRNYSTPSQLYTYFKDCGELDRLKGNLMIY